MQQWIQSQLAAGLPAFAGTSISGTLAVTQELLNELIATWLREQSALGASPDSGVDFRGALTTVKTLAVRAEPGRVLVDFSIAV
jgi:hypothetical protein